MATNNEPVATEQDIMDALEKKEISEDTANTMLFQLRARDFKNRFQQAAARVENRDGAK